MSGKLKNTWVVTLLIEDNFDTTDCCKDHGGWCGADKQQIEYAMKRLFGQNWLRLPPGLGGIVTCVDVLNVEPEQVTTHDDYHRNGDNPNPPIAEAREQLEEMGEQHTRNLDQAQRFLDAERGIK